MPRQHQFDIIREKSQFSDMSEIELIAYFIFLKIIPTGFLLSSEYRACLAEITLRHIDCTNIIVKDPSPTARSLSDELHLVLAFKNRFFEQFFPDQLAEIKAEVAAEEAEKQRILHEKEELKQKKIDDREKKKKAAEEAREEKRLLREAAKLKREEEKKQKEEAKALKAAEKATPPTKTSKLSGL